MIEITNRTALITGSSRGIGQQIAVALAKLGCNIIVHGRSKDSTSQTLKSLSEFPVKSYSVHGDLSKEEDIKSIIDQVRNLGLQVDILYNNAAIMIDYKENIWTHTREDWIDTFKVNVIAMYELCGAFIPPMIENGFGRVVNLTSGIKDLPELAPYGSSKWAVDKLTDDVASKLENTGVRINVLDPGWLKTDMGGENADHEVEAVLPGGISPVLIENDGPNGKFFSAIENRFYDRRP